MSVWHIISWTTGTRLVLWKFVISSFRIISISWSHRIRFPFLMWWGAHPFKIRDGSRDCSPSFLFRISFLCQTEACADVYHEHPLNARTDCSRRIPARIQTPTSAYTFMPLSKHPPSFWHSWTQLAQHLFIWEPDSSAWQIRDFSARRCIRVSFVCCSCLSGSCLLRWLSNPQALITQSCLSHWYGSCLPAKSSLNKTKGGGCHCALLLLFRLHRENICPAV